MIGHLHDPTPDTWNSVSEVNVSFVLMVFAVNRTPLFTRAPVVFLNRTSNCRWWAEEGGFCQDVVVFVNVHCRHNVDEGTPSKVSALVPALLWQSGPSCDLSES